jgi:hypothetical protein
MEFLDGVNIQDDESYYDVYKRTVDYHEDMQDRYTVAMQMRESELTGPTNDEYSSKFWKEYDTTPIRHWRPTHKNPIAMLITQHFGELNRGTSSTHNGITYVTAVSYDYVGTDEIYDPDCPETWENCNHWEELPIVTPTIEDGVGEECTLM